MLRLLPFLLLLGCPVDPAPVDDDDASSPPGCPAEEGPRGLEVVGREPPFDPLPDGFEFAVQRQYQGAIALEIGLRFTGYAGGEPVGALEAGFVAGDEVLASRTFEAFEAVCDSNDEVIAHGFEVFFAYGGLMPDVDGVEGELRVTVGPVADVVPGVLRVAE